MPTPPSEPTTNATAGLPQTLPARAVISKETRDLLGPPPLTNLEDGDAYETILSQIAGAVVPKDLVEWIWVKDIVDLIWDAARARRAKTVCLLLAQKEAIFTILTADKAGDVEDFQFMDPNRELADEIHSGDEEAMVVFDEVLDRLGMTRASVNDVAFHTSIKDMERLQQLVDLANSRRDAVLKEIDRRRDAFSKRLALAAAAVDDVIDAEFEDAA